MQALKQNTSPPQLKEINEKLPGKMKLIKTSQVVVLITIKN